MQVIIWSLTRLFYNVRSLKVPVLITLANGNKVKVSQFGDIKIDNNLALHHNYLCYISNLISFQSKSLVNS